MMDAMLLALEILMRFGYDYRILSLTATRKAMKSTRLRPE